ARGNHGSVCTSLQALQDSAQQNVNPPRPSRIPAISARIPQREKARAISDTGSAPAHRNQAVPPQSHIQVVSAPGSHPPTISCSPPEQDLSVPLPTSLCGPWRSLHSIRFSGPVLAERLLLPYA